MTKRSATCIACGASDLEHLAPDLYRCRSCGYEGGEGAARAFEARQAARRAQMSPEEARATALQELRTARLLVAGSLPRETTVKDAVGIGLSLLAGVGGQELSDGADGASPQEFAEALRLTESALVRLGLERVRLDAALRPPDIIERIGEALHLRTGKPKRLRAFLDELLTELER